MAYHSDYDVIGFRKNVIMPALARHGITLNLDQGDQSNSPQQDQAPTWKMILSLRTRLSVFEAVCALSNVDPFSEADSVERFGVNEDAYDMNKTLLDEAMDIGMVQGFEKREGDHTEYFVDAKSLAAWCDKLNFKRPLPWNFERVQADTDLQREVGELRQKLAQATDENKRLALENSKLFSDSMDDYADAQLSAAAAADKHQRDIDTLHAEIAQLREDLAQAKDRQPVQQPAEDGGLKFRHETRLLHLVAATQERYAGENLDIFDRDTWPKKADVIEWLREQEPGLSGKVAEGIDAVAMPFSRGK